MASFTPDSDYTNRDFDSLRARGIEVLKSRFPNADTDSATFTMFLLELQAYVGDVQSFYLDAKAREGFTATAQMRRSMIDIGQHFGYRLHGASAATSDITITSLATAQADITIPAGTVIKTKSIVDPIKFQTLAEVKILAGSSSIPAQVEHSESHTQTFTASNVSGEEIFLDRSPFLDASQSVSTAAGAWIEVTTFLSSGENDRHYRVFVDDQDRAMFRFGDGQRGARPSGLVTITYKTGGGSSGNVESGALVVVSGSYVDGDGNAVQLSATNAAKASGGAPRESLESARISIPESIRVNERSVTRGDFEFHASAVSGVARAAMVTSNEDVTVGENTGILYIVPEGGGAPSQTMIDDVLESVTVTNPHTLTFSVSVIGASYHTIDVSASITIRQGVSEASASAEVKTAINAFFAISQDDGTPNANVDFGLNLSDSEIAWSDIFNTIIDLPSVLKMSPSGLTLNGSADDEAVGAKFFPIVGDITVINAATGQEI